MTKLPVLYHEEINQLVFICRDVLQIQRTLSNIISHNFTKGSIFCQGFENVSEMNQPMDRKISVVQFEFQIIKKINFLIRKKNTISLSTLLKHLPAF